MNEKMNENKKYHVRAFDTDYGFDTTWTFTTWVSAEMWCAALLFDYGQECQAYVYTD